MENNLRKIILAVISVVVSISVTVYLTTLPEPILEKPYVLLFPVALLFLYWILLINWYSKRKRK